jgi:hypothetical protein
MLLGALAPVVIGFALYFRLLGKRREALRGRHVARVIALLSALASPESRAPHCRKSGHDWLVHPLPV